MCPEAVIGETGDVNGIVYTKRSSDQITTDNATTTCTSGITDMSMLFSGSNFNKDIGSWDVSSVTNMREMFSRTPFNQDIGNWDVSSVDNMSWMFNNSKFNKDIGNWDVSSVIYMNTMFALSSFNRDISSWDVSAVKSMRGMFMFSDFNQDISDWDVSSVFVMSSMFRHTNFNQDISDWVFPALRSVSRMFADSDFNQDIGSWDVSSVEQMDGMFANSKFNQDISHWDVSSVKNMSAMFYESRFNQDIGNWDVSSVLDMSSMFAKSSFSFDIKNWDVSAVRSMAGMFSNSSFNHEIGNWDVSSVTNMREMFAHSNFNQDISNWDVSNVKYMERMFIDTYFNHYIGDWDVSIVRNMSEMFAQSKFDQNIGNWDVSSVTNMSGMFTETPFNKFIGNWDVSAVIDMREMFKSAESFNQDIGSWDVSSVGPGSMEEMFYGASSFNQNLRAWCVFYINYEPYNFSTGSLLKEANKPLWGVCPKVPSQIVLNSPANDETNISLNPELSWEEDSNATGYQLILKESPDSTLVDTVLIDSSSFTISEVLNIGTTYSWKVRGVNLFYDVYGKWSTDWSFTTQSRFLAPPQLISPSNGQENVRAHTEFEWSEANNATFYLLQVSADISFNELAFESLELESTSYTLTEPLNLNIDYYWRVKSLSDIEENNSVWSDTLMFKTGITTTISESEKPVMLTLTQNYPNPFNPTTNIRFGLPEASVVQLEVYNMIGQRVALLQNGMQTAGWHDVSFDASNLTSGIYLYRLQTEGTVEVKKMILVK